MNAYTVHLADGTSYVTSMNATPEEARKYFMSQLLNVGQGGEDRMMRVLAVTPVGTAITPCVNSDAQQETTHGEQPPQHVHEWVPLGVTPTGWQDVCVDCGEHRFVPKASKI
jgi:hypothetical protein